MYVTTYATLGQSLEQNALGQCATTPAGGMTFAEILTTIGCELQREFRDPNDPRLLERRRRLRELFNAVPPTRAKDLFDQLQLRNDPLAQLFRLRLATPTRKELFSILFFAEYDLRSVPSLVATIPIVRMTQEQKIERITDVNTMVSELLQRRNARAADAPGGVVTPAKGAPSILVPATTRLSTAQLDLFREFFSDGARGINFEDFQRSFEQFNNGELRAAGRTPGPATDPLVRGQREPQGAFEFLFAEFAFLCIDSGNVVASATDVANWTKALRVFVQTQEIFIHVYRPAPHRVPPRVGASLPTCPVDALGNRRPRRPLDGLTGFDMANFNALGQSNFSRKVALRAKYARMNVAALRNAARDNLIRAQCI